IAAPRCYAPAPLAETPQPSHRRWWTRACFGPDRLSHRILEGAGFSEVSLTPLDADIQLAGPKGEAEAADFVMVMGPLVRVLPSLSAVEREEERATLEVYFSGHDASDSIVSQAEIRVARDR